MAKEDKQLKKLHKMYDRLTHLVGKDNADRMIDELITRGVNEGEMTDDEAIQFREELGIWK